VKHTSRLRSQIISNPKQNEKLKESGGAREYEGGNTFTRGEMIETEVGEKKMDTSQ
jgi:hypothetical protein